MAQATLRSDQDHDPKNHSYADMIRISGGTFRMGSDQHYPEEAPVHRVTVDAFWIDRTPVTNRQFRDFVRTTGHVTFAERRPDPKDYPGAQPHMLYAGSLVFSPPDHPVDLRDWGQWWTLLKGADWRHPYGRKSSINGLDNHPVVHVTYADALAYAQWAGKDLPTEAEWEFAARGGLDGAEFTWGGDFTPDGRQMANTWNAEKRSVGNAAPGRANYRNHVLPGDLWQRPGLALHDRSLIMISAWIARGQTRQLVALRMEG
jgi:sulfatase modifying factor 1